MLELFPYPSPHAAPCLARKRMLDNIFIRSFLLLLALSSSWADDDLLSPTSLVVA